MGSNIHQQPEPAWHPQHLEPCEQPSPGGCSPATSPAVPADTVPGVASMGWMFPPCRSGGCSTVPLLCRVAQGQGCAQPLASNVQSVGPRPNAAEIPEGKYLGNGLQTTIAFKLQSKPFTGKTENPGNILCTKHGQLLAGYFMTHRARSDEKVQFAPVLSCARGALQAPTALSVVFGPLGTVVVPKEQTLAVAAGARLEAGMTKR